MGRNKLEKLYMLRQEKAAEAARTAHIKRSQEASGRPGDGKRVITLAGLRFMGEEPHPSQAIDLPEVSDDR